MSSRLTRTQPWLSLLVLVWAAHSSVLAQPSQSLAEKRLGIIKGTTPGIVLFDFGATPPRAAAFAPAPAPAGVGTSANVGSGTTGQAKPSDTKASDAPAYQPPIGNRLLSNLPPPSGKSLQSARRLDAPDQGIQLRTTRDEPQTPAEPATKR